MNPKTRGLVCLICGRRRLRLFVIGNGNEIAPASSWSSRLLRLPGGVKGRRQAPVEVQRHFRLTPGSRHLRTIAFTALFCGIFRKIFTAHCRHHVCRANNCGQLFENTRRDRSAWTAVIPLFASASHSTKNNYGARVHDIWVHDVSKTRNLIFDNLGKRSLIFKSFHEQTATTKMCAKPRIMNVYNCYQTFLTLSH